MISLWSCWSCTCFKGAASHHNTESTLLFCEVRNVLFEFNCKIWILQYAPNYLYVRDAHPQPAWDSYICTAYLHAQLLHYNQTCKKFTKGFMVAGIQTNALSAPADAQLHFGHRCRANSSFLTTNSQGILPTLQSYAWYKVPYTLVLLLYKGEVSSQHYGLQAEVGSETHLFSNVLYGIHGRSTVDIRKNTHILHPSVAYAGHMWCGAHLHICSPRLIEWTQRSDLLP